MILSKIRYLISAAIIITLSCCTNNRKQTSTPERQDTAVVVLDTVKKQNDSIALQEKIQPVQDTATTLWNDTVVVKQPKKKKFGKYTADMIFDSLFLKVPEIKRIMKVHSNAILGCYDDEPPQEDQSYEVGFYHDEGDHYCAICWFRVYIYPRFEIKVCDMSIDSSGDEMTLQTWQKNQYRVKYRYKKAPDPPVLQEK